MCTFVENCSSDLVRSRSKRSIQSISNTKETQAVDALIDSIQYGIQNTIYEMDLEEFFDALDTWSTEYITEINPSKHHKVCNNVCIICLYILLIDAIMQMLDKISYNYRPPIYFER